MAVDAGAKAVRFRTMTASLRADKTTEADILAFKLKYDRGLKGFAYILHDKDKYTEKEAKDINNGILATIEEIKSHRSDYATQQVFDDAIAEQQGKMVNVGDPKYPHWHILMDWGRNAKEHTVVAEALKCEPNMIQSVRGKKKGFANMLAYMTHITDKAREDGKHEYPFNAVKGLRFPDDPAYSDFQTYADFARAFEEDSLHLDLDALMVMQGKITPKELKKKKPDYYLNNMDKVKRARLEYIRSMPTPAVLFNFYVGASNPELHGGRIGKGIACQILAVAHLKSMFPNIDFEKKTLDELEDYIFYAGGDNVTLDSYDGQPIIIWEDVRSYELIKLFGGINRLFKALDTHPKPIDFNIKYGKMRLKNHINIFNGVESYHDFIDGLSQEWRESENQYGRKERGFVTKEDKTQALGRFPFFIEVSPEFVTAEASLQYLLGHAKHDFKYTVRNNLVAIAQHNVMFKNTAWLGDGFIKAEDEVKKLPDKSALPTELFKPVDLDAEYEDFKMLWHDVFASDIQRGLKHIDGMIDKAGWIKNGAPNSYDPRTKEFYRKDN